MTSYLDDLGKEIRAAQENVALAQKTIDKLQRKLQETQDTLKQFDVRVDFFVYVERSLTSFDRLR